MKAGNNKKKALRWIIEAAGRRYVVYVFLLAGLNALTAVNSIITALLFKRVVDNAAAGNASDFTGAAAAFAALMLIQLLLYMLMRWMNEYIRSGVEKRLKVRCFNSVISGDYSFVSAWHTGELNNRMTNDTVVAAEGFQVVFPDMVSMLVRIAGAAGVLFVIDRRFALVFFSGGLVMLFAALFMKRFVKGRHKEVQEADGRFRSYMQEVFESLLVVKAYSRQSQCLGEAKELLTGYRRARMDKLKVSNLANLCMGLALNGSYLFAFIWSAVSILHGNMTYGTLTAVIQLVNQITKPFTSISGLIPKYYSMTASAERIMELENCPKEADGHLLDKVECGRLYDKLERIVCSGVSFSYDKDEESYTISDVTFDISKGELFAIRGESGIGKSTILKLLLSVYRPAEGSIYFELSDGSRRELSGECRSMFAYVPQGNFLMSGSIAEAVCFFESERPDMELVKEVCHIAYADTFIEQLSEGYDTQLGERGSGLSEGQIQRLAVARALYTRAPILLLDESTSALDATTERKLLNNLKQLTDRTVIIVTHRTLPEWTMVSGTVKKQTRCLTL